jgi:hypothetical protein
MKKRKKRMGETFEAICVLKHLPGIIHEFLGFFCYVPDENLQQFKHKDRVRVTVERISKEVKR